MPTDASVIKMPAMTIPEMMAVYALFLGILNNHATNDAVHAPVMGSGIAVKDIKYKKTSRSLKTVANL